MTDTRPSHDERDTIINPAPIVSALHDVETFKNRLNYLGLHSTITVRDPRNNVEFTAQNLNAETGRQ
jgi:hypothetical protein